MPPKEGRSRRGTGGEFSTSSARLDPRIVLSKSDMPRPRSRSCCPEPSSTGAIVDRRSCLRGRSFWAIRDILSSARTNTAKATAASPFSSIPSCSSAGARRGEKRRCVRPGSPSPASHAGAAHCAGQDGACKRGLPRGARSRVGWGRRSAGQGRTTGSDFDAGPCSNCPRAAALGVSNRRASQSR